MTAVTIASFALLNVFCASPPTKLFLGSSLVRSVEGKKPSARCVHISLKNRPVVESICVEEVGGLKRLLACLLPIGSIKACPRFDSSVQACRTILKASIDSQQRRADPWKVSLCDCIARFIQKSPWPINAPEHMQARAMALFWSVVRFSRVLCRVSPVLFNDVASLFCSSAIKATDRY
jgi:hypothetical protein